MGGVSYSLTAQSVKELYEQFPFPNYPLYLPINHRKGFYSSSLFAAQIFQYQTSHRASVFLPEEQFCPRDKATLVVGCGETLPFVMRKWQPQAHKILCVDIAEENLKRLKQRMFFNSRNTRFICDDIDHFMMKEGKVAGPYDHIDVYGVLHHLGSPSHTLSQLAKTLHPNGTMRVMVYNSAARRWIRELQHAFRSLGLRFQSPSDISRAKLLLSELAKLSPSVGQKLGHMRGILQSDPRFVDCFFHTREIELSCENWMQSFSDAGLEVMGLLDDHTELDDLPNPLWHLPTETQLAARLNDRRFENNLTFYIKRSGEKVSLKHSLGVRPKFPLLRKKLAGPPPEWFTYNETRDLSIIQRHHIWSVFLDCLSGKEGKYFKADRFEKKTVQRLARIGALLPASIPAESKFFDWAMQPMTAQMEVEPLPQGRDSFRGTKLARLIMDILHEKSIFSERRFFAIMDRFMRSQSSSQYRPVSE